MARKIRIEYPGAVYHVMSRGDHQEAIYRDDADRVLFLKCLDEACEKTGWQIHKKEDWKRIRRGWYLGEASFKDRLLDQIGMLLDQRKAESVSGEAVRARTEQAAEQWVQKALRRLELDDTGLHALPKGAEVKLVMAWWLRCQTTMRRKWIAQRLGMGHETRVTLAVRVVSVTNRGRLARLRQQIEGL